MGTNVAPSYAHLTMGYLELLMQNKCKTLFGRNMTNEIFQKSYFRFLDGIIIFWKYSSQQAHIFIDTFNNLHPSLMKWAVGVIFLI